MISHRMKWAAVLFGSALSLAAAPASQPAAPASQPAASLAAISIRAQQAFNRGEYATALPLLKQLASDAEKEPARLASLQERIRVCEKAIASARAQAPSTQGTAVVPAVVPGVSAEARKPHTPAAGQVYDVTIQSLGNFEYDQEHGGNIPADVKKLTGTPIRLRGYMIPMDQAENITQFALVPSLFQCCFGQPPQIQHTIVVNCPKGKAIGYTADEILVEGELKVQEKKDDGYIISLFEMQVASVKLAPKG